MDRRPRSSGYDLLRAEMARRGMGQGALERAIGVTKGTAHHWLLEDEGKRRRPDLDSALAIERELGVPVHAWASKKSRARKAARRPAGAAA